MIMNMEIEGGTRAREGPRKRWKEIVKKDIGHFEVRVNLRRQASVEREYEGSRLCRLAGNQAPERKIKR